MADSVTTYPTINGLKAKRSRQVWLILILGFVLLLFYIVLDVVYYRYTFQKQKLASTSLVSIFRKISLLSHLDKKFPPYTFLFQTRYYQGKIIEIANGRVKLLIDGVSQTFEISNTAILLEKSANQQWVRTIITSSDIGRLVTLAKGARLAISKNAIIIRSVNE